jgi:hypothetical protein
VIIVPFMAASLLGAVFGKVCSSARSVSFMIRRTSGSVLV